MWLEIKAVITIISCVIIALIVGITGNIVLAMMALVAIIVMISGDITIGWKIINTDAINLLDPNRPGERTVFLHLIGGGLRVLRGKKVPRGKIEFLIKKIKASVIDEGTYPVRTVNGNSGVVAHESYDKNINYYKSEALKTLFKTYNVDNVKDLYPLLIQAEKNNGEKRTE